MGFITHIPGTNPLPKIVPHPRRLGVGVVGLHEGRTLLLALATRTSKAYPVAGCDVDAEKVEASRRELPGLFYTSDLDEMLRRPEVDIVAIYTPDDLHAEQVERAMRAGKHVICTKPLTISVEGARRIERAASATGRRLLVGQSTRFFESFRRQRAAYERGEVGRVELADAHYIHRMDWYYDKSAWVATRTDWVFLGLSHPLDLLRWYLGPIARVHATASTSALGRSRGIASPDIYLVSAEAQSGALGRAMGHYGVHELPRARNCVELMLYGDRGSSLAQYHDMRYVHTGEDHTEIVEDHLYAGRHYYFNSEVHGMHYGEFANYAEHFAGAILEGTKASPELEEGIEVVALMESVRRSARSGRAIEVSEVLGEIRG